MMGWLFKLLTGVTLILAGLGFACSGLVSVAVFGAMPFALEEFIPGAGGEAAALPGLLGAGFSAIFVLVGLVLLAVGGVLTYAGARERGKLSARADHLETYGVEAEGTITFLDRNYGVLVNNRPIYSIVEYTFQDRMGREHTGRVDNFPSEVAIRSKLEVGSTVRVKYLAEDPTQSTLLPA